MNTIPGMSKTLQSAITKITREIEPIRKEKVKGLSYQILSGEAVLSELRPRMASFGITMLPVDSDIRHMGEYQTKSGARMAHVVVRVSYRLSHADSGESIDIAMLGEASDSADKAVAKAISIAQKYALRQVFLLQSGNDPDRQRVERAAALRPPPQPLPMPQPVPKPAPQIVSTATPVSLPSERAGDKNGALSNKALSPALVELTNLINQLRNPAAATRAICDRRQIPSLEHLPDIQARELVSVVGIQLQKELFGESLSLSSTTEAPTKN